ncbi:ABC transporter ATP-binding protein [Thermaerobacillus caldiproteolyticus]|uniref:Oligopeptide transport system ATP-binding protein n=1 Tax=Thermaerobacillus caldiproteolyticus TaxID=247480 RepID=A0A7V9Z8R9_9BACL|nr:ABC transporter ATP-binding protein [Anoxybacillus caldiproteolyticus]MBA2876147.1 oligopeptide transport system ATP-binding protein [Anoxybacillus caldiproteolyticus]QPA32365.1 ABC transporter ATP-binding protein [Anoxybacillus caldiproteolyticus]
MSHLLKVENLQVSFKTYGGEVQAVRNVSFHVDQGEVVAIVGESGSGKSVTVQTVMGLIPIPPGKIKGGKITFSGKDITNLSKREMRKLKGSEIGMVFQDPMTSLNPTMKIGKQIAEGLIKHQKLSKAEAKQKAIELLKLVGIPNAAERYNQYPHEFSGGMRQRVVIAIALACAPKLLIADEPTTALDVTIQAQILDLMKDLQRRMNTAIILITHDLGVVAEMAQRVIVMYGGIVVETGTVFDIFERPKHPYTWGLLESIPKPDVKEKKRLIPIEGSPPDLFSPPKGCPFAPRCKYAMEICVEKMPGEFKISNEHIAKCWLNDPRAPQVEALIAAGRE